MELSASEKMLQLMDAEKIGVSWDGGKMKPQMSVAGVYLISRKDILSDCRDCANCIGQQTGCAFCCTADAAACFFSSSSPRGCLIETPKPDIFITGIFFSSFPCAINTAVGVGRMAAVCEPKGCWTCGDAGVAWAAGACCTGWGCAGVAVVLAVGA